MITRRPSLVSDFLVGDTVPVPAALVHVIVSESCTGALIWVLFPANASNSIVTVCYSYNTGTRDVWNILH